MSAQGLPAHILSLFGPRPPAEPLPQSRLSFKTINARKGCEQTGVSEYLELFEDPAEVGDPRLMKNRTSKTFESSRERKVRIAKEKWVRHHQHLSELLRSSLAYDPKNDPNIPASSDPLKTVFVARISYDTSERKLKKELETYGPIKRLKLIYDKNSGKPRGYGFVEYYEERDARQCYKLGDGRKIDGRRIMVDVERGRTQGPDVGGSWLPRRLGGGRGSGRKTKGEEAKRLEDEIKAGIKSGSLIREVQGRLGSSMSMAQQMNSTVTGGSNPKVQHRSGGGSGRDGGISGVLREKEREREMREREREREREKERERELKELGLTNSTGAADYRDRKRGRDEMEIGEGIRADRDRKRRRD